MSVGISEATRVVHTWSGPRSLSTAFMYSFAQRPDCKTFDEPLYAAFLRKFPAVSRPYREELLAAEQETSDEVLHKLIDTAKTGKLVFAKHMARHCMDDLDPNLLIEPGSRHIILVRNPLELIMSWNVKAGVHNETNSSEVTGLLDLMSIYTKIRRLTNMAPLIVDMDSLKKDPERILRAICRSLDIPFFIEQLSWPAGPKPGLDGMWAPYWYDGVHKSTGFVSDSIASKEDKETYRPSAYTALSAEQLQAYREAIPFYEMLQHQAVGQDAFSRGTTHCPPDRYASDTLESGPVIDHGRVVTTTVDPVQPRSVSLTDPRNADILVWVGDRLLPREYARVSVFDSSVQGGDAVWEGMRVYNGRVFMMEEHIDRLFDSAHAMNFSRVPCREYIKGAIFNTLKGMYVMLCLMYTLFYITLISLIFILANGMCTDVHMRVTLSRGTKVTSSMNPVFNVFGCSLLILAEWKPVGDKATYGSIIYLSFRVFVGEYNNMCATR